MLWWFLKKLDTALPHDPTIPLLGYKTKRIEIFVHPYSQQHYSQNPKERKKPKCPLIDEWINKV